MSKFIPWNSQSLESWSNQYANGKITQLNGLQTHYLETGQSQADKPPLILLHGLFYDALMWSENIHVLAQHFKVYALDLWGFGYSAREPLDYSYPLFAKQISLFMQSQGLPKASIIGHGMGAGTAIQFASENPDQIEQLILVDAFGLPNFTPLYSKIIDFPFIGPFILGMNNLLMRKKILGCHLSNEADLLTNEYLNKATWSQKIFGTHEIISDIEGRKFLDKLSDEIHHLGDENIPTLIIWGRQDKIVPFTRGKHLQDVLRGAKLEIIDNAGHLANFEQATIFNQLALDFLLNQGDKKVSMSEVNSQQPLLKVQNQ